MIRARPFCLPLGVGTRFAPLLVGVVVGVLLAVAVFALVASHLGD
jgi:hypothetical protein